MRGGLKGRHWERDKSRVYVQRWSVFQIQIKMWEWWLVRTYTPGNRMQKYWGICHCGLASWNYFIHIFTQDHAVIFQLWILQVPFVLPVFSRSKETARETVNHKDSSHLGCITNRLSVFRHNGFVESSFYKLYIFTVPGLSAAGKCGSV